MKKGDVVTVRDFSYSRIVEGNKLSNEFHAFHPACRKQFVVVETDCKFPTYEEGQTAPFYGSSTYNNTVIQAINSDEVVFIEERFLKLVLPTHKVMVDVRQDGGWMYGQIVEISDKLYKEIKRGSES